MPAAWATSSTAPTSSRATSSDTPQQARVARGVGVTRATSPAARAVLGDSITLTAVTITVEDQYGHLYVHALDRSLAEGIENSEFQRLLLELEEPDAP